MYSCQSTTELREDELRRLLAGATLLYCPTIQRSLTLNNFKNYAPANHSFCMIANVSS